MVRWSLFYSSVDDEGADVSVLYRTIGSRLERERLYYRW